MELLLQRLQRIYGGVALGRAPSMMKKYRTCSLQRLNKKELIARIQAYENNYEILIDAFERKNEAVKGWKPVKHGYWMAVVDSNGLPSGVRKWIKRDKYGYNNISTD